MNAGDAEIKLQSDAWIPRKGRLKSGEAPRGLKKAQRFGGNFSFDLFVFVFFLGFGGGGGLACLYFLGCFLVFWFVGVGEGSPEGRCPYVLMATSLGESRTHALDLSWFDWACFSWEI